MHKASGGSWGGCYVDHSFLTWLTQLVGQTAMQNFKSKHIGDYFEFIREFETKKRKIGHNSDPVTLNVPNSLIQSNKDKENFTIQQRIDDLGLKMDVKFVKGTNKIRVGCALARGWFTEAIESILKHLRSIVFSYELQNINAILIVGGFGECKLVQDAIRTQFPDQRIIVPNEGGLAVLKGAVQFGYMSGVIKSRKMRYTYGIATRQEAEGSRDLFEAFVCVEVDVEVGSSISKTFWPICLTETSIRIYASSRVNPRFIDDENCKEKGSLTIDHIEGHTIDDKKFQVQFFFGETEIRVLVTILMTGKTFEATVNCL